jgi:pyruvate,water dikinase
MTAHGTVKLMVRSCRTVDEGRRVQAETEKHGLRRGEDGLEVYVMCEMPRNVLLPEEFAEVFDGFSIASVIAAARAKGRKVGMCYQTPSDYPEFAQFLVEQGIDSISLNPDTVLKTTVAILDKEREYSRVP